MSDPRGGTDRRATSGPRLGPGREFDRIRAIVARLGPLARGIGDDCALVPAEPGDLVISTDLSVEGVHFRRDWLTPVEIGWRAAAAALSDLAADAARPVGVLTSIGVPRDTAEAEFEGLTVGIAAAVESTRAQLLGGDLSVSDQWLINITVLGRSRRPVLRSGARPGDTLWVTGELGGARAALVAWQRGELPDPVARRAFAHPVPRWQAGLALAAAGATAMIDLSDGLAGDATHLAAASSCGLSIELERLPVAASVAAIAGPDRAAEFAAQGGEDYELLAALPAGFGLADATILARELGVSLTRIGSVESGQGVRLLVGGQPIELPGYDHFA